MQEDDLFCKYCEKKNEKVQLKKYQVNPKEAIYMCPREECLYPLAEKNAKDHFLSSKLNDFSDFEYEGNTSSENSLNWNAGNTGNTSTETDSKKNLSKNLYSGIFSGEKLSTNKGSDFFTDTTELTFESEYDLQSLSFDDLFKLDSSPIKIKFSPLKMEGNFISNIQLSQKSEDDNENQAIDYKVHTSEGMKMLNSEIPQSIHNKSSSNLSSTNYSTNGISYNYGESAFNINSPSSVFDNCKVKKLHTIESIQTMEKDLSGILSNTGTSNVGQENKPDHEMVKSPVTKMSFILPGKNIDEMVLKSYEISRLASNQDTRIILPSLSVKEIKLNNEKILEGSSSKDVACMLPSTSLEEVNPNICASVKFLMDRKNSDILSVSAGLDAVEPFDNMLSSCAEKENNSMHPCHEKNKFNGQKSSCFIHEENMTLDLYSSVEGNKPNDYKCPSLIHSDDSCVLISSCGENESCARKFENTISDQNKHILSSTLIKNESNDDKSKRFTINKDSSCSIPSVAEGNVPYSVKPLVLVPDGDIACDALSKKCEENMLECNETHKSVPSKNLCELQSSTSREKDLDSHDMPTLYSNEHHSYLSQPYDADLTDSDSVEMPRLIHGESFYDFHPSNCLEDKMIENDIEMHRSISPVSIHLQTCGTFTAGNEANDDRNHCKDTDSETTDIMITRTNENTTSNVMPLDFESNIFSSGKLNECVMDGTERLGYELTHTQSVYPPHLNYIYPVWQKKGTLSWLDSSMSLLVNNKKLKSFFTHKTAKCQLKNILNTYEVVLSLLNSYPEDSCMNLSLSNLLKVKEQLNDIREKTFNYLKSVQRSEKVNVESPISAISILIKGNSKVNQLFLVDHQWSLQCEKCGAFKIERQKKPIVTFPDVPWNLSLKKPYYLRPCFTCKAPNQKMVLHLNKYPDTILFHFSQGLPQTDFSAYDYTHMNFKFKVTGLVQYSNEFQIFMTWIRHPGDESWLCCNDLGSSYQQYSNEAPTLNESQIQLFMWEKVESVKNVKNKMLRTIKHDIITPDSNVIAESAMEITIGDSIKKVSGPSSCLFNILEPDEHPKNVSGALDENYFDSCDTSPSDKADSNETDAVHSQYSLNSKNSKKMCKNTNFFDSGTVLECNEKSLEYSNFGLFSDVKFMLPHKSNVKTLHHNSDDAPENTILVSQLKFLNSQDHSDDTIVCTSDKIDTKNYSRKPLESSSFKTLNQLNEVKDANGKKLFSSKSGCGSVQLVSQGSKTENVKCVDNVGIQKFRKCHREVDLESSSHEGSRTIVDNSLECNFSISKSEEKVLYVNVKNLSEKQQNEVNKISHTCICKVEKNRVNNETVSEVQGDLKVFKTSAVPAVKKVDLNRSVIPKVSYTVGQPNHFLTGASTYGKNVTGYIDSNSSGDGAKLTHMTNTDLKMTGQYKKLFPVNKDLLIKKYVSSDNTTIKKVKSGCNIIPEVVSTEINNPSTCLMSSNIKNDQECCMVKFKPILSRDDSKIVYTPNVDLESISEHVNLPHVDKDASLSQYSKAHCTTKVLHDFQQSYQHFPCGGFPAENTIVIPYESNSGGILVSDLKTHKNIHDALEQNKTVYSGNNKQENVEKTKKDALQNVMSENVNFEKQTEVPVCGDQTGVSQTDQCNSLSETKGFSHMLKDISLTTGNMSSKFEGLKKNESYSKCYEKSLKIPKYESTEILDAHDIDICSSDDKNSLRNNLTHVRPSRNRKRKNFDDYYVPDSAFKRQNRCKLKSSKRKI